MSELSIETPDEDAAERMQIWILPAHGGEPRQLTDEPLGVSAFRFAKRAPRLVMFAPVLADVAAAVQRETATKNVAGYMDEFNALAVAGN